MGFLTVNGARIAYRTFGDGPALLAPECNFSWTPDVVALMCRRFTLVIASPRDFGASSRRDASERGRYQPHLWADDMLAVMRHLGHQTFSVFGYSFTGAFGPWLALRLEEHSTIVAVASGGFPLLGDYRVTSDDVERQLVDFERDERRSAELRGRFDLRAGAAFYRDLASLRPDSLVDELPCPLYSFWGDQDTDAVEMVMPHAELGQGLTQRGVSWRMYPGLDHEGLNGNLAIAWPEVEEWLLSRSREPSVK